MSNETLTLNANPVVAYLQKPAEEFTKADIIKYVCENDIRMINFMYPGGDGKLKTLNFVITNLQYLDTILTCGERVDGSSLFSFIQAGLQRPVCAAPLPHGFPRSFCRDSHAVDALLVLRQRRTAPGQCS